MEILIVLMFGGFVSGLIGLAIGDLGGKRNRRTGFALGFLLGPIGWIITAVIPASDAAGASLAAGSPDKETQRKIEFLEAQLAELKGLGKDAALPAAQRVDEDSIPIYRLD